MEEPALCTEIPGPRSRALAARLARVESRNVTALFPESPIFWERAAGANVWDVDGNRFVDLGGAFGVVNAGHAHPRIVTAIREQSGALLHGMGDVHPARIKVELLERLSRLFPGGGGARGVLSSSGSDAVETALKTALLATGKPGVVAFEGAYHGLSLGALDATWRADFRDPFSARLPGATRFVPYGELEGLRSLDPSAIGAVLVEPVQGRAGERVPPRGFLRALRALCDERGWLLIADEVYTGFGRTGRWFACDHENVIPDLLCVGKGIASGMPLSACLGRATLMDVWPESRGEALHTQTFLGHPVTCAAALASISVLEDERLVERSANLGAATLEWLRKGLETAPKAAANVVEVRGIGLMIGIEGRDDSARRACRAALQGGVVVLPSGPRGEVLSITPPLTISEDLLRLALQRVVGGFGA
jgi:4-aminobutyrate aminotransferase-like enzyme